MTTKKPNILLIIVDHMAFAGHYGNDRYPYIWPNLEKLAKQGAWFERAYTAAPICTPARASIMTGQRPSRHGLRWNSEYSILQNLKDFRGGQRLYAHSTAAQGYRNAYVGKWHCGLNRLPIDYGIEGWGLPEYGNLYGSEKYKSYLAEIGENQPFCRIEHNLSLPDDCGTTVLMDPPNAWKYMEGCGVLEGPASLHEQFFLAHTAEQSLRALAQQDQPFCLVASFWGPHQPYYPSEEFAALVKPEDIPVYPSFDENLQEKPLRYSAHRDLKGDSQANVKWPSWDIWQTVLARCYAQGLQTDAAVGQLLGVLDELNLAEDTLVILTADHGDTIASHGGVWDKHSTFPEELARIPLVLRWPNHIEAGKRVDKLVTSMDVTGTALSAAGADIDDIDGRNLVPLCQSEENTSWPDHLICEHYGHSGDILHQRIAYKDHWKYVAVYGADDELYNLNNDPYELVNLVKNTDYQHICSKLRALIIDELRKEREIRAKQHPPSELEYMLVDSTPQWPREEKMLLYKLEQMMTADSNTI
ncbi:MAG: sulfatase-like hydrolase/transferase [Arenicella sp.]